MSATQSGTSGPGYTTLPNVGVVKVGSIGVRVLARVIDGFLLGAVFGLLIARGVGRTDNAPTTVCDARHGTCQDLTDGSSATRLIGLLILFVAIAFTYEWLMVGLKGATLGKMACRLGVLDLEFGDVPGLSKSARRAGTLWAPVLIPVLGGLIQLLEYASAFFDRSGRNRTWYDRRANTQVISTRS